MAAARAGARGKRVLVLERNAEPGAKILISGGGRCNFTNLEAARAERYLSANPRFAKSALARFGPQAFLALVERHRIPWYEKTLGQLFCEGAGSARKIVRLLLDECAAGGVEVRCGVEALSVEKPGAFRVETSVGPFEAEKLIIATGGLSIPKLGAGDFAHRIARRFGLALETPQPGLVPLTHGPAELARFGDLAGVSASVRAGVGPAVFEEALLFTHRGLSGPAVLQASSYWAPGDTLTVDFTPGASPDWLIAAKRANPRAQLATALRGRLPERLAGSLGGEGGAAPLQEVKDADLRTLAARLARWTFSPAGTEGYAKAEVTCGGVATQELDGKTMQARAVPGLYFVGEGVDVTGWLGGYNFQWAWASGWCAGEAV